MEWSVCYKRAIQEDGSLLFPERLTQEFLDNARRTQGSYIYANQYQNEIIPLGETPLRKEWIKYYETLPRKTYNFAFIDPAISQADTADFTALIVVSVDEDKNWYLRSATRYKITPTEIVDLVFRTADEFKLQCLGIEDIAYQKALLYMVDEEMRRRGKIIPVKGINPGTDRTKEMRIMGLVPNFEFGYIYLKKGMYDLEMEYSQFPRGSHDDLLDALASIKSIAYYPPKELIKPRELNPRDKDYERQHIQSLHRPKGRSTNRDDENSY